MTPHRVSEFDRFRRVGRYVAARGLVSGSEGNLSAWDGSRLVITRTGSALGDLQPSDVLVGTVDEPPAGASSDLARHRRIYEERGGRAVVHVHPPGSVPSGWREGEPHGLYATGTSLEHALAGAVAAAPHADARSARVADAPAAPEGTASVPTLWFDDYRFADAPHGRVSMIDQTRLPHETVMIDCASPEEVGEAIKRLAVRGAPLLGIAAAYGMVLGARRSGTASSDALMGDLRACGDLLVRTRPTAVNIEWAVERALARARGRRDVRAIRQAVLDEARAIEREDGDACSEMGWFGAELIPEGANVLTHCNTGLLCTAGIGTAFGVLWCAHISGKGIHVWVDETRPALQGARLTAWELQRLDVPFTVIPDSAAASLMGRSRVDAIVVGADRIAANGDVANKIGTYSLAIAAQHHGVPFYVVAPTSTVDPRTASGGSIRIEERDPAEVTEPMGVRFAPTGARALNPAFDVTPAALVTAIVTERGVATPPYARSLARMLEAEERPA